MAICERCGKEHDGSYKNPRFCSLKCALTRVITEEQKRKSKETWKKNHPDENYLVTKRCLRCGKEFTIDTRKSKTNYCCMTCRNTHKHTQETKDKISKSMNQHINKIGKETFSKRLSEGIAKHYKEHPETRHKISVAVGGKHEKFVCPVCGRVLWLPPAQARKRKYCSGTCRNKINNKLIKGTRSKAEQQLEEHLTKYYPNLLVKYNDRELLNGLEVDVYIPELKLVLEWNGIFHYRNIQKRTNRIKESDIEKQLLCKKLGLDLYVIKDETSSPKFIKEQIQKFCNYLRDVYNINSL